MTQPKHDRAHPPAGTPTPSTAGLYDAYQHGEDAKAAYTADRDVARRIRGLGLDPQLIATQNRAFVIRAVDHAARNLNINQFLDVGCGFPADPGPNVHTIVENIHSDSRILYVDHDPIVRAHADALLHSHTGTTTVVQADLRDPDAILSEAQRFLDFTRPIGLLLAAVVHFLQDEEQPHTLVARLVDALPPGSTMVLSHATDDFAPLVMRRAEALLAGERVQARTRSRTEIARLFTGLSLVEPGLVPVHQWHQPDAETAAITPSEVHGYGATGIKLALAPDTTSSEQLGHGARLSSRSERGVLIISVSGMVEERETAPLRDRLDTLMGEARGDVVLDLTDVQFLDSAALGAVLGLRLRMDTDRRELHLLGGAPVRKLLRIMGFTVPLHAELTQAIAAAQSQRKRRRR
ncbi:SAM-dependent methyltransferase [Streptomyces albipurpureus]|uniref:SAM-dependent methyltransferase n=1 Tax=Streptomyces albipurpureus TaxID=2897419 RepID=A0ABT0UUG0_9ACTN|nr:SAM-dependent methyltransferase [Streptomyces sp. CWNU-1]MCM2392027.1 SAM-dependent methyltransferase [Streptomyces sp. CWNU-1]